MAGSDRQQTPVGTAGEAGALEGYRQKRTVEKRLVSTWGSELGSSLAISQAGGGYDEPTFAYRGWWLERRWWYQREEKTEPGLLVADRAMS